MSPVIASWIRSWRRLTERFGAFECPLTQGACNDNTNNCVLISNSLLHYSKEVLFWQVEIAIVMKMDAQSAETGHSSK